MNMNNLIIKNKSEVDLSIVVFSILVLTFASCRKLVDVTQPINRISDEAVYSTDATAASTLTGFYASMDENVAGGFNGELSFTISTSLAADELYLESPGSVQSFFFQNALINAIHYGGNSWGPLYNYVYRCNAAIEGIAASNGLSAAIKQQLLGESYFLRAFYYFHLVNLYGPVPLALSTDYKKNTLLNRAPVDQVYQHVIDDLKKAKDLLSDEFMNSTVNGPSMERVRPTKWAAVALLARAYLYNGNFSNASMEASNVINNTGLFSLLPLNDVFIKNSQEAIWQLQPVNAFFNTWEARLFILKSLGITGITPFYLSPSLINSIESGDQRFIPGNWVDSIIINDIPYYYAYKYKVSTNNPDINPETGTSNMTEYQMLLRLSEQYLIRAEALAQQNDLAGAITDLDIIRSRAGLPLIADTNPAISKEALLDLILHERRVELFTEPCHRWFDLKRTGKVDAVMSIETPLKGGIWDSREVLFPVPLTELDRAPNLIQNPGYPDL
jgi:starch-binding outer membrane protein, SusD/RagB family